MEKTYSLDELEAHEHDIERALKTATKAERPTLNEELRLTRVKRDEARRKLVRHLAGRPECRDEEPLSETTRAHTRTVDEGLRAIDRHRDVLTAAGGDRLDKLVRGRDGGLTARYLAAVADPDYNAAFGEYVAHPHDCSLRWTDRQREAWRTATSVQDEIRALSTAGSAGGYAIPFALDPSVLGTSNLETNPLRGIARVDTIGVSEKRYVTSAGVTVTRAVEAAAIDPVTPTLVQPTIRPTAVRAEIQFSLEVEGDWSGMQAELAQILRDAKDTEEAEMFVNGLGPDTSGEEPAGIISTLPDSREVPSGSASAFGVEDVYALKRALPARYRPGARWMASDTTLDAIRQFADENNHALWATLGEGTPELLLGKPVHECTTMSSLITTTAERVLLYGNFRHGYAIVDRVGMSLEVDPHVRDGNGKWTGQRALLAFWRNSAGIIDSNAFRVLSIQTS